MEPEPLFFATPAKFRAWLEIHHQNSSEQWVGFYKKGSGRRSITWPEAVDEARWGARPSWSLKISIPADLFPLPGWKPARYGLEARAPRLQKRLRALIADSEAGRTIQPLTRSK